MATLKGVALKGDVMNIKEEILAQMDSALRPEFDKAIDNTIEGAFKEDVKTLGFMVANSIKCQWEVMKPHLFYSYCLGVKAQEAKAQAVPEGFVLVPKENISCFWQDNDEPENFCNSSNDWDCLGDGIEKDQIMIVNKHTQAHISTEKFFGVWKLIKTSYGTRWKFELFKSEFEAKQAMIEAQEPAND